MPVFTGNATGMENTRICRHFANLDQGDYDERHKLTTEIDCNNKTFAVHWKLKKKRFR